MTQQAIHRMFFLVQLLVLLFVMPTGPALAGPRDSQTEIYVMPLDVDGLKDYKGLGWGIAALLADTLENYAQFDQVYFRVNAPEQTKDDLCIYRLSGKIGGNSAHPQVELFVHNYKKGEDVSIRLNFETEDGLVAFRKAFLAWIDSLQIINLHQGRSVYYETADIQALHLLGEAEDRRGERKRGKSYFQFYVPAVAAEPESYLIRIRQANAVLWSDAEEPLKKALAIYPAGVAALREASACATRKGDEKMALELAGRYAAAAGKDADYEKCKALRSVAGRKYSAKDNETAIRLLREALTFCPANEDAYKQLLDIFSKEERLDEGFALFPVMDRNLKGKQAVEIEKKFISTFFNRAIDIIEDKNVDVAEKLLGRIVDYLDGECCKNAHLIDSIYEFFGKVGRIYYIEGYYKLSNMYYDRFLKYADNGEKFYESFELFEDIVKQKSAKTLTEQRSYFNSLVRNKNDILRVVAVLGLGNVGTQREINMLLKMLTDASPPMNVAILVSLSHLESHDAESELIKLLDSKDEYYIKTALRIIQFIRLQKAVPYIIPLLQDNGSECYALAIKALVAIADKHAVHALLNEINRDGDDKRGIIPSVRDRDILRAFRLAGDSFARDWVFGYIARHLVSAEGREYLGQILEYLMYSTSQAFYLDGADNDVPMQYWASVMRVSEMREPHGLLFLAEQGTAQEFLQIVHDHSRSVEEKSAALLVLGVMKDPCSLDAVINATQSHEYLIRFCALCALTSWREGAARDVLAKNLPVLESGWKMPEEIENPVEKQLALAYGEKLIWLVRYKLSPPSTLPGMPRSSEEKQLALTNILRTETEENDVKEVLRHFAFWEPYGSLSAEMCDLLRAWIGNQDESIRFYASMGLAVAGDQEGLASLGELYLDPESEVHNDYGSQILVEYTLARFRRFAPIFKYFLISFKDETFQLRSTDSSWFDYSSSPEERYLSQYHQEPVFFLFNFIRKNGYFSDEISLLTSSPYPLGKATGYYLKSLHAREAGDYQRQLESAKSSIAQLDPVEHTPFYLLALWQKAQAELKLNRCADAQATLDAAQQALPNLMRQDYETYGELFDEYTLYLQGEALLAAGQSREAMAAFETALKGLDKYRHNPLFAEEIQRLEKLINNSFGIAMRRVGSEHLEKARELGREIQANDSWELDNEERGKLELARNYLAEGRVEKAQEIFEEITLSRQKFANRRLQLSLADPEKQAELETFRSRQREIDTLSQQIAAEARRVSQTRGQSDVLFSLEQLKRKKQKELRRYITQLKKTHPDLALLMGTEPLELKSVQDKLPADVAIVQYLLLSDQMAAFVITADDIEIIESQIDGRSLKSKVEQYRTALIERESSERVNALGAELYAVLIKPVEQSGALEGMSTVGIAPCSYLHYLPFSSLVDGGGKFLLEKYTLFGVSSTSILWVALDRGDGHGASRALLALGNPDGTLPAAGREVTAIGTIYPESFIYHDQNATTQALREHLPASSLIHLSTHGILDPRDSSKSYLVMADGKLSVEDIWGLPLNGARLTTLSACDTGIGEILSGDDIISMENAFIYAGSPSVVSTLWPIADASTAELMEAFYTNLRGGMGRAESLRQAQLDLLHDNEVEPPAGDSRGKPIALGHRREPVMQSAGWKHPYYWAAFTLSGDWR